MCKDCGCGEDNGVVTKVAEMIKDAQNQSKPAKC